MHRIVFAFVMEKPQIPFPQSFDMKLIVVADIPTEQTKDAIELALARSGVEYRFVSVLASSRGRYLSYAYHVTVDSMQQMECMYAEVRDVEGLKFTL